MHWYIRACPVCGGDGHDDPQVSNSVICFLCGRSIEITGPTEVRDEAHLGGDLTLVSERDSQSQTAAPATRRARH